MPGEHLNPGPCKYKSGVIRLLIVVTLYFPTLSAHLESPGI